LTTSLRLRIGLAFIAFILIGANDGAIGILLPGMSVTYGINNATISALFLTATAGYFVAALNNGPLVAKLGNRLCLLLGAALMLIGYGVISTRPPFALVLLALVPVGFGTALLDAGLNAYVAGLPQNTTRLNYLHAFYGTGALLGPIIASTFIALRWQWNTVYLAWVCIAALLVIGFGFIFKDNAPSSLNVGADLSRPSTDLSRPGPESRSPADSSRPHTEGNILFMTLRLRAVWLGALFLLIYVGAETSLGSWSYSFLTEERHGAALLSGWTVSGYWLGLTLSRLLLGKIAAHIGNKRMIQLCLCGIAAGLLLVWLIPSPVVSAAGLFLTGFSLGPIFPTTIALMSQLVSSRLLSSTIGFIASFGSMGAAFFPWFAGNVTQHIGLWFLLPYALILSTLMFFLWLALQAQPHATLET
jgi:fucose permease